MNKHEGVDWGGKISQLIAACPVHRDGIFGRTKNPPVFSNIVCTVNYGTTVSLRKMVEECPHVEYDKARFAASITRCAPPRSCALIFHPGKCVVNGVQTLRQMEVCLRHYAEVLHETGHRIGRYKFKIQNCVMTARLGMELDLANIYKNYRGYTEYDPGVFPGLRFHLSDLCLTVTVFETGCFNIVGFKTARDGLEAYDRIYEVVKKYPLSGFTAQSHEPSGQEDDAGANTLKKADNSDAKTSPSSSLSNGAMGDRMDTKRAVTEEKGEMEDLFLGDEDVELAEKLLAGDTTASTLSSFSSNQHHSLVGGQRNSIASIQSDEKSVCFKVEEEGGAHLVPSNISHFHSLQQVIENKHQQMKPTSLQPSMIVQDSRMDGTTQSNGSMQSNIDFKRQQDPRRAFDSLESNFAGTRDNFIPEEREMMAVPFVPSKRARPTIILS
jgi:TATA-box binding protein (TBP) (component of TFIID and TFIIIB)